MAKPFHPDLYDPNEPEPTLRGTRCGRCGTAFFPPFGIGCEVCGAPEAALAPVALRATGVIHSVATVHLHLGKDIEAPFTIAEVALDDGPLIRATLTEVTEPTSIGAPVRGRWVPVSTDDEGDDVVELRFEVVGP